MKVSVFSGMFKEEPIFMVIEKAAEIGYDAVEIMVGFGGDHLSVDDPPDKIKQMAKCAQDNGIPLCLIYTTLGGGILAGEEQARSEMENLERFLDIGDVLSCKMIKVTAGRLKHGEYSEDNARKVADWLAEASDRAARHDARIIAEIHFGQYCETVAMARDIIDLVNRDNFGVIHDAGNLHITGDHYGEKSVEILGDKIFHVHIKDMVKTSADDPEGHDYLAGRFKRALIGHGDVDHLPLFKALLKMGYDGYLSCEASGKHLGSEATARHELEFVRRLVDKAREELQ